MHPCMHVALLVEHGYPPRDKGQGILCYFLQSILPKLTAISPLGFRLTLSTCATKPVPAAEPLFPWFTTTLCYGVGICGGFVLVSGRCIGEEAGAPRRSRGTLGSPCPCVWTVDSC